MGIILYGNVIHVVFENICGNSEIRINPLAFIILKLPNLSSDKVNVKKCKKKKIKDEFHSAVGRPHSVVLVTGVDSCY